jgi:hypothetical protein
MATADEYAAWIVQNQAKKGTPEFDTVAKAYQAAKAEPAQTDDPTEGNSFGRNLLIGVGKAISDTGTGLAQIGAGAADLLSPRKQTLGGLITGQPLSRVEEMRQQVAETRARDAPLMNTVGGFTGDVAGNVGMMLLPGGALKVAGRALAAPVAELAGGALLAPRTIAGAGAVGAGMGAAQPSTSTGETLTNIGLGAGASAAAPAAVGAFKAASAAAEPLYAKGREAIMGRLLNRVAGADAPEAAARLSAAGAPYVGPPAPGQAARTVAGEIVPGSMPTVGQASGNAGIASLERTATAIEPTAAVEIGAQRKAQNAARIAEVEAIAGTSGNREAAELQRSVMADRLYAAARAQGVDKQMAIAMQPQIENLLERMPAGVLEKAKELARVNGEAMGPVGSINGLHWIKKGVDDILSGAKQTGIGKETERAVAQFKGDLMSTIEDLSPAYAKANATFALMSKPINQMEVAQALLDRGTNKVTGTLEPGKFINNLTDKTAASATGFNKATLEGTLTNAQLNRLNAVKQDLQRSVTATNSAGTAGSDTVKKLAYSNFIDAAGVPTWLRNLGAAQVGGNIAARGADALYGRANMEMSAQLAALMRDPAKAGALMTMAQQPGNERFLALIARGGAAMSPALTALLHAQQQ